MVPRAGDTANSYTHQTSKTDQDHLKIWVSTHNAGSAVEIHDTLSTLSYTLLITSGVH